jgi:hypothetical protein
LILLIAARRRHNLRPRSPKSTLAATRLGSHLARLELSEALTIITRRMPNPRRSGPACWKQITGITGPIALPLEFDPGH